MAYDYHYSKSFGKLTIQWELLDFPGFRVNADYNGRILVPDVVLDENNPSYPFSYYPTEQSQEPLARGILEFHKGSSCTQPTLMVSLSAPIHQEDIILYPWQPKPPYPPIPPGPTPIPPAPTEELEIKPSHLKYQDLFPYLFIRPWPQVTPQDMQTRFVPYTETGAEQQYKELYNKLETEHKQTDLQKARADMKNEAVLFIDGKGDYQGQYIAQVMDFKTDLMRSYLVVYQQLQQEPVIDYQKLNQVVESELGGWKKVKSEIQKIDYKNDKERAWESFFALTITLGYRYSHLDNLIKIIITANLIETIAAKIGFQEKITEPEQSSEETGKNFKELKETETETETEAPEEANEKKEEKETEVEKKHTSGEKITEESQEPAEENQKEAKEETKSENEAEISPDSTEIPLPDNEIYRLSNATIKLPGEVFPLPPANQYFYPTSPPRDSNQEDWLYPLPMSARMNSQSPSPGSQEWLIPYAVGKLQMVQYKLKGYEPGEICHIENILKGECKEVTQRKFTQVKTTETTETQETDENSIQLDQTTTDLLDEVNKTLYQKSTATNYTNNNNGDSVNGWTVDENPTGGAWHNSAKFGKDIINRTVNRISKQVNRARTFSTLDETEETVNHRFDNTQNNQDIIGIYRWVNKLYTMQTLDYGNRLVLEIMIEEPASEYLKNQEQYHEIELEKPESPEDYELFDYSDIYYQKEDDSSTKKSKSLKINGPETNKLYYLNLLEKYEVQEILPPPPSKKIVTKVLQGIKPFSTNYCTIPEGYTAEKAQLFSDITNQSTDIEFEVVVGITNTKVTPSGQDPITLHSEENQIPISIMYKNNSQQSNNGNEEKGGGDSENKTAITTDYSTMTITSGDTQEKGSPPTTNDVEITQRDDYYFANIEIECYPTDETINEWKYKTWLNILKGYQKKLEEYNKQLSQQKKEISSPNPMENRELEKQQIKMKCFKLLKKITGELVGWDTSTENDTLTPQEISDPAFQQYFENTLEWEEMSYSFYPNYGNRENYNVDYSNTDFKNFLRAEKARVLLPVIPWRTLGFLYFLSSGSPWSGEDKLAPTIQDNLYVINDIKQLMEGKIYCKPCKPEKTCEPDPQPQELEWDVLIPTSMKILQGCPGLPKVNGEKEKKK
jgi:hypothetical protein